MPGLAEIWPRGSVPRSEPHVQGGVRLLVLVLLERGLSVAATPCLTPTMPWIPSWQVNLTSSSTLVLLRMTPSCATNRRGLVTALCLMAMCGVANAFMPALSRPQVQQHSRFAAPGAVQRRVSALQMSVVDSEPPSTAGASVDISDRVIRISERAMAHLADMRTKQTDSVHLYLRMGVRSGGCSGMSYAMDLIKAEEVTDEDHIEEYPDQGFSCVVDPKSMLYLFGMVLDYKDALIGGGFQFMNPNAEETCGCGKSFGV